MAFQQFPQKGGIPSGNTAARPTNPVIGDTYYNGQLGLLEIFDGTNFVPCSSPAATPSVAATDVGTARAYGSGQISLAYTPGASGGAPYGYTGTAVIGATTYTTGASTANPNTLVVGGAGEYSISASAYNGFGVSPSSVPITLSVTTVPQAPTIGAVTLSSQDVTVNWTLQNNGGKNLTSITITPYLNGTTAETTRTAATTSSTSYTFTGASALTAGSAYTFKVKATNANGDSLESSASSSITVPSTITIDYLVVAGGGGGGNDAYSAGRASGGGGAGGLRSTMNNTGRGGTLETALSILTQSNYTVTVGAGGAAMGNSTSQADQGINSVFSTITSLGGGAGGGHTPSTNTRGADGGSGGGGGNSTVAGAGTTGQGYDSGTGSTGGGGGGGAGANGANGTSNASGNGGDGVSVSITGTATNYAGGGGGGGSTSWGLNTRGLGGSGGGGNGALDANASAGSANTGGGGGGGRNTGGVGGGAGGSGVVILRWLTSAGSITVGAGLTADSTGTDGSYSYKRFTAGSGNVSWS